MPQVQIETFHSLTVTTFVLIFFFFSFVYYYITPFWSVVLKLGVKKSLTSFFLLKTTKNQISKLALKTSRSQNFLL